MDAMLAGEPWLFDPVTVPLPWRKDKAEKSIRPLRIGYYFEDGSDVRVQPPLEQAVRKAGSALSQAGHEGKSKVQGLDFLCAGDVSLVHVIDGMCSLRMGHERAQIRLRALAQRHPSRRRNQMPEFMQSRQPASCRRYARWYREG